MYGISLHSACAAAYQHLVDRGKGTNYFEIPDPWCKLQALLEIISPCNKLPDIIFEYWNGLFLKCCCDKPVIVGIRVGHDGKRDKLKLTTHYGKYRSDESWCKTIDKWLDKKPTFLSYDVSNPSLLPNGHLFDSTKLFHSHSSELLISSFTLRPDVDTYSNAEWNLSTHSKENTRVEESVESGSDKSTKSNSLEMFEDACSKPYKFIREPPMSSPYDMSFVKFRLPKWKQLKFKELSVTNQFEVLTTYTRMLRNMINIDDKVHVVCNNGTPVWVDRGIDTCIPWLVNMPCPFNTYDESDQPVTTCTMPKEVYEDRYSFLAHWYLFHICKEPYRA